MLDPTAQDHAPLRRPTALLLALASTGHHFEGVDGALRDLGVRPILEILRDNAPIRVTPAMAEAASVIIHADGVPARALGIRHAARRAGKPVALLMDGVLEFANTFLNPAPGPGFLRPAPADFVLAAGAHDRAILRAMGNRTFASGLPRLEAFAQRWADRHRRAEPMGVLVATANHPAFTMGGRVRLLDSLALVRDAARRIHLPMRWRIAPDLAEALQVEPDRGALIDSLAASSALMSTASTLVLEGMLAGLPTAILHPHPWPLWLPAAWLWRGDDRAHADDDRARVRDLAYAAQPANDAAEHSIQNALCGRAPLTPRHAGELLEALLNPDADRLRLQAGALERMYRLRAAARVAGAAEALARAPSIACTTPSIIGSAPTIARANSSIAISPAASAPPCVVSCIEAHSSTVGGVSSWSQRMERFFQEHPELGVKWHTLFIGPTQPLAHERLADRPRAHAHTVDLSAPVPAQSRALADALAALEPGVVLPNYGELSHAAAMHLRARGGGTPRVVAIAHTNDAVYRRLFNTYHRWDSAVAVSHACDQWVREGAAGRPVELIPYGVPTPAPRALRFDDGRAPLRLAYIGRVVEAQKRVSDLLAVLDELRTRRVAFEFHLVGDGEALPNWQRHAQQLGLPAGAVTIHGPRPMAWVESFLPTVDLILIPSEAEGLSITMLEAMASGVLPCVTRVDAAIDDLLTDGENAIVVPIGEPRQMAERIGALSADRSSLRRAAHAARDTITQRGYTIAASAARYAELLRLTAQRSPAVPAPTDLGLLAPGAAFVSRAAVFEEDVERFLRDAGYRTISRAAPPARSPAPAEPTAVIIRATDEHPGRARIAEWRARGIGVAVEPDLSDDSSTHFVHEFERLRLSGCSRIAVCVDPEFLPALEWMIERRGDCVVEVVHPAARAGTTLLGVPALSPAEIMRRGPYLDAVFAAGTIASAATYVLRRAGMKVHVTGCDPASQARIHAMMERAFDIASQGGMVLTAIEGMIPGALAVDLRNLSSVDRPDALILPGEESDFSIYVSLRPWRSQGTKVHSLRWTDGELASPERFAEATAELSEHSPYAIYGGGMHTERLLNLAAPLRPPLCILDDHAADGRVLRGIPVVQPDHPLARGIEVIVLSSTRFEAEMWARTATARAAGIRVVPLCATPAELDRRLKREQIAVEI